MADIPVNASESAFKKSDVYVTHLDPKFVQIYRLNNRDDEFKWGDQIPAYTLPEQAWLARIPHFR